MSILFFLMLLSCTGYRSSVPQLNNGEYIYWINSATKDCQGVGPMKCLEVQKNDTLEPGKWQLFYSQIEGFTYEPGYVYQLIIKEEQIPADRVPADGSSIKYTLVKQLEKKAN
ncbi:DUF4377 domain-containing protein [Niabella aquatica]